MLVINYNGNKPTTDYYKYSVQGNNLADTIRFLVSLSQNGLVFDNTYHIYAKVQCVDDDFYDKVELSDIEFDDTENLLKADFHLESKHTSHRQIEVSLSCENLNSEVVWQTQLVKVAIANGVNADEGIENNYPTILEQLQQQIDELKQQGGGGGASDVEIKRVYLTYDYKRAIKSDYLGFNVDLDGEDTHFINDSTHIWFNFETTPINAQMEEEIKNGRFVIRLDYPIATKNMSILSSRENSLSHLNTRKCGAKTRSFTNSFATITNERKKAILLNSLIFVNEQDVKENAYGEKYIHKKVSFYDYITKTCKLYEDTNPEISEKTLQPITIDWLNNDSDGIYIYGEYIETAFSIGIPARFITTSEIGDGDNHLFSSASVNKFYTGYSQYSGSYAQKNKSNSIKLNPAFSCYTLLKNADFTYQHLFMFSPYFIGKNKLHYQDGSTNYLVIAYKNFGKQTTRKAYMSAKPRCAILNDDYENAEQSFIKTYKQSDQQIKLYCKAMRNVSAVGVQLMPIFRTLITQK